MYYECDERREDRILSLVPTTWNYVNACETVDSTCTLLITLKFLKIDKLIVFGAFDWYYGSRRGRKRLSHLRTSVSISSNPAPQIDEVDALAYQLLPSVNQYMIKSETVPPNIFANNVGSFRKCIKYLQEKKYIYTYIKPLSSYNDINKDYTCRQLYRRNINSFTDYYRSFLRMNHFVWVYAYNDFLGVGKERNESFTASKSPKKWNYAQKLKKNVRQRVRQNLMKSSHFCIFCIAPFSAI